MKPLRLIITLAAMLPALPSVARTEWQLSGYAGAESRWFANDPLSTDQVSDFEGSVVIEPELYGESGDGTWAFLIRPFARIDFNDDERSHFDFRELYAQWRGLDWEVKAGLGKVFWGVTESRHRVDIINQTDLVENIDGEDKLGQPMVQLTRLLPAGTLDLFVLPAFRERTFPGQNGRLRTFPAIDMDNPIYESDSEEWHTDFAARLKTYWGAFDIGLSYFYGTSRDPLFIPNMSDGVIVLQPVYNLIHQGGLDLQYTTGSWLWKFEAIVRSGTGHHFKALTGGFEYTFYGVFQSNWDIGVLAEYHYDDRGELSTDPFNDDIFMGARFSANDEDDTALLVGGVHDFNNGSRSFRVEFERRIFNQYKLAVEAQVFSNTDQLDPAYTLRNDSFVAVELRRYF